MPWKMPPEFAFVPFRCCPKIYLKPYGGLLLSKMSFLRRRGRHECFTSRGREVPSFVHCQRRGAERARLSYAKIVGRTAERTGIDGHERRMRLRRVRFVLRFVGRHAGEQLSRSTVA